MGDDPELRRLLELVQARLAAADSTPTVDELWETYDKVSVAALKPRSQIAVRARFRALLPFWGTRVAARLSDEDEALWRSQRLGVKTYRKTLLSPLTYSHEMLALLSLLNWAVRTRRLGSNPLRGLKLTRRAARRRTRYTEAQLASVFEVSTQWFRLMVLFICDSGLRPAELLTLDWNQIEKGRALRLRGEQTKNGKPRTVPLSERTTKALIAIPRSIRCSSVFTNPNTDKPWSQRQLNKWWRAAADDAGVKGAPGEIPRFYDWRHTFGTRLNKVGVSLPAIRDILGHSDYRYIDTYVATDEDDVLNAASALERLTGAGRAGPQRAVDTIPDENTEQGKKNN